MIDFNITVHNDLPLLREHEPVTMGIPFARGVLTDSADLVVKDKSGAVLPSQARMQSLWGDGSVRWALLHFIADLAPGVSSGFHVTQRAQGSSNGSAHKQEVIQNSSAARTAGADDKGAQGKAAAVLKVSHDLTRVRIDTGAIRFDIDGANFRGFENVRVPTRDGSAWARAAHSEDTGSLYMKDKDGKVFNAMWGKIKRFEVEESGPVVATVVLEGEFADDSGAVLAEYDLWIRAFAGQGTVRAWVTVRNPRATIRRELGHWPLGLGGSIYFKEVGWTLTPMQEGIPFVTLHGGALPHYPLSDSPAIRAGGENRGEGVGEVFRGPFTQQASLVQDSSGGQNWFHRSHVNKDWRIPLSYKGFKAFVDGREMRHGDRAEGWVALEDTRVGLAVGIRHFWQNFPKAVRAQKGSDGKVRATAALWPAEFDDVHELQGGEQKTHEMVFHFYRGDARTGLAVPYNQWPETQAAMCRALHPPMALAQSEQYAESGAFDYLGLYDAKRANRYERANEGSILAEPTNLRSQIEFIDEYGWRNFGDFLADGEINGRVLSHYNLEYDMGYACLMQAVRTADARPDLSKIWWNLAEPSLRHESDLDVYHTSEDAHGGGVYNHGKHHHTDHGYEAGRSTHRAYEDDGMQGDLAWYDTRGGGPETQHMGSRGMLTYAWMAGYPAAIKVVKGLADLIHFKITTNQFPQYGVFFRDSGHSLQILIEGYHLTGDRKYLDIGRRVIDAGHPDKQGWANGFPVAKGTKGHAYLLTWAGGIFFKEVARFLEIQEMEGEETDARALSLVRAAGEAYNRWAWDEKIGRYAHSVQPDGTHFRYNEPWWDLKVLEMVTWACRWQEDAATRELWLSRAQRNFEEATKLLDPNPKQLTYLVSKSSTVTGQNGPGFLVLERMIKSGKGLALAAGAAKPKDAAQPRPKKKVQPARKR